MDIINFFYKIKAWALPIMLINIKKYCIVIGMLIKLGAILEITLKGRGKK
jgi:hypothetical protein